MRICIPVNIDNGLDSKVCAHFGSAPYFLTYNTDKRTVDVITNGGKNHVHGACNPIGILENQGIDVVICKGVGARAVGLLNAMGIKAYKTISDTARPALNEFKSACLKEITPQNACVEHNCN